MIDYWLVDIDNPLVGAHRVLGQPLLPGLAYIDLIHQIFRERHRDARRLALRNVSIHRPLAVREEQGVLLGVACTEATPGRWRIEITGRAHRDGAAVGDPTRYLTAEMHERSPAGFDARLDIVEVAATARETLDLDEVYARCRELELLHGDFMRARGRLYLDEQAIHVELALGEAARASAAQMLFHPALIDGAAVGASIAAARWQPAGIARTLALPLFYEAFEADALLQDACVARIRRDSLRDVNELSYQSIEFFDRQGVKLAELRNLAGKLVRDPSAIDPHRAGPAGHAVTPASAGDAAAAGPAESTPATGATNKTDATDATEPFAAAANVSRVGMEQFLRRIIGARLRVAPQRLDAQTSYYELGIDSAGMLELVQTIEARLGMTLSPTLLFEHVSIAELAAHLATVTAPGRMSDLLDIGHEDRHDAPSGQAGPAAASHVFDGGEAFLRDHRVLDAPALMGVTHPCLVLQAAWRRDALAGEAVGAGERLPLEARNIRFRGGPVTLAEGERAQVAVHVDAASSGAAFKVEHRTDRHPLPRICCDGDFVGTTDVAAPRLDLGTLLNAARPLDAAQIEALYARTPQFHLGPLLRTIEAAWRLEDDAQLLRIEIDTSEPKGGLDDYLLDPLALCACYYLHGAQAEAAPPGPAAMAVPLAIERLVVHGRVPARAYVLIRVRTRREGFVAFDANLIDEHGAVLVSLVNATLREVKDPAHLVNADFGAAARGPAPMPVPARRPATGDIAIVGLSGRYPQADSVGEYWENLLAGRDCISEIPAERWDHARWFDARRGQAGKTYSKWGGFLRGVDEFDPLFFHVAPAEARVMDPQERLFLQCAYAALEDAGYTRANVVPNPPADPAEPAGSSRRRARAVGVFVGVMSQEYQLYGAEAQARGLGMASSGSLASIANRVSYFGNFHGPSLAVDTMCSSSLTAIHLACQSLRQGQCAVAIAGGVNVTIHPNKYLMLAQGQFASSDGRCTSFGEGGDGYVPGEGVGAVVLKPLAQAEADGDHIYGVIKGSAINHGGRTSGYTVPNPQLQAQVIDEALRESGVHPRAISYIEAHGTGTSLGDPIEIAGLVQAFGEHTRDRQFCAIGSAKSNVGHCESAAGMAGLTKLLLQMKHGTLVKSLHSETLNPHIDFAATPFVVPQQAQPWQRPVLRLDDGEEREYPRVAGLSSFGAGGANAHLIVEEYVAPARAETAASDAAPVLVVLSARNEARLREQAARLAAYLDAHAEVELADLAYTLQVGREAMSTRLAMVTTSIEALREALARHARGEDAVAGLHLGDTKADPAGATDEAEQADLPAERRGQAGQAEQEAQAAQAALRELDGLARRWVRGLPVEWTSLHERRADRPRRIALPTYPFARERYWVPSPEAAPAARDGAARLHPLVHRNSSDFGEQRFSTTLSAEAFFLRDHVVRGECVLPGVVQLEWARAAVELALGGQHGTAPIGLEQVSWLRPLVVSAAREIHIALDEEHDGRIAYEIYADGDSEDGSGEAVVYSRGWARVSAAAQEPVPAPLDLDAIRARCTDTIDVEACYARFDAAGLAYGPTFRGLEALHAGPDLVLARIAAPRPEASAGLDWLPGLLDAALQASAGLPGSADRLALPFAVGAVRAWGEMPTRAHALVRRSGEAGTAGLDVTIADDSGAVRLRFEAVNLRAVDRPDLARTLLWAPCWEQAALIAERAAGRPRRVVIVLDGARLADAPDGDRFPAGWREALGEARDERLDAPGTLAQRYERYALDLLERIRDTMAAAGADGEVLLQLVVPAQGEGAVLQGLRGLLGSARQEYPQLTPQLVAVDTWGGLALRLHEEARAARPARVVRHGGQGREVLGFEAVEPPQAGGIASLWRDAGVYWIVGGLGGLGRVLARAAARAVREPVLVLSGRRAATPDQEAFLAELRGLGARAEYRPVDVADESALSALAAEIVARHGALHGVVQGAGVLRDGLLAHKSAAQAAQVLHPKVAGVAALDAATRDIALDWMMLCSSASAVLGNVGQTDYAAANGFLDAFAGYREALAAEGRRHGRTLSLGWPLWAEGGMQVDADTQARMLRALGMRALPSEAGVAAFAQALALRAPHLLVLHGDRERLLRGVSEAWPLQAGGAAIDTETGCEFDPAIAPGSAPAAAAGALPRQIERMLTALVSEHLQIAQQELERRTPFSEFGFDSIKATSFVDVLNRRYGLALSPTVLFEAPTLATLATHLAVEHGALLAAAFTPAPVSATAVVAETPAASPEPSGSSSSPEPPGRRAALRRRRAHAGAGSSHAVPAAVPAAVEPIAIIGVSGSFPQSPDLDAFWANLEAGRDCIGELPQWRWNGNAPERPYAAGVLDDIDAFDPLFFGISPREAQGMDPQQRLLMTYVHKAIEDAGYSVEQLSGSATALIVGTGHTGYGELLGQAGVAVTGSSAAGLVGSMGPNRMSYWLNWHGPSEPVETACSSSLVAIHRAVMLLRAGQCEQAVVGGINTLLSRDAQDSFAQAGMLSRQGRCRTFSASADGYVRGEGVGMLFLKPLAAAERDGDHIYGLVAGSAENHGGRANSLTAPNPVAQARLIEQALRMAGIDPRTLGYIEAHGTGTPLGDPIEIEGLKRAIRAVCGEAAPPADSIGLGSVKSNIGHLEMAAGVAGVLKVLLQMRHARLVRSLHADTLNPQIRLAGSPFYVVGENRAWPRPVDAAGRPLPRRAGVSSFGFGGVNAHVVLEEYLAPARAATPVTGPVAVLLSARDDERLREQAARLLAHLEHHDENLADLAWTLQVGRDAMNARLAIVVESNQALREALAALLRGETAIPGLYRGELKGGQAALAVFEADEELQEAIGKWIARGKLGKLAELWVQGLPVEWARLHGQGERGGEARRPRRLALPTYPFARERYWAPSRAPGAARGAPAWLHPLVHRNTSDLGEQRFSTTLSGEEFFLRDHVVRGRRVVPGVAQLEWARAAVALALGRAGARATIRLEDVSWLRPLAIDGRTEVHIGLVEEEDGRIAWEIYREDGERAIVHGQGWAVRELDRSGDAAPVIDLAALGAQCTRELDADACYARFVAAGLAYGPTFRALKAVRAGEGLAIGELEGDADAATGCDWLPNLLDSALQSSLALADPADGLSLPFAVGAVRAWGEVPSRGYAVVQLAHAQAPSGMHQLDVTIVDAQGQVRLVLERVMLRAADGTQPARTLLLAPQWQAAPLAVDAAAPARAYAAHRVLVLDGDALADAPGTGDPLRSLQQALPAAHCLAIQAGGPLAARYPRYAQALLEQLRQLMREGGSEGGDLLMQVVVPTHGEAAVLRGLHGLLRSARQEFPRLVPQLAMAGSWQGLARRLGEEAATHTPAALVRDGAQGRETLGFVPRGELAGSDHAAPLPWRDGGVYWITGGLGGLGRVFAQAIAETVREPVLVLSGRGEATADQQAFAGTLRALGARVDYRRLDVGDAAGVAALAREVTARHGALHGVIHAAGVLEDGLLPHKDDEQVARVLWPKVAGAVALDEATRDIALDWLVFCSSAVGVLGNLGQTDYAAANGFMDAYAAHRDTLVAAGKRHGRGVSLSWPLWAEGGMRAVGAARERVLDALGMQPLSNQAGVAALHAALQAGEPHLLVLHGERDALLRGVREAWESGPRSDAEAVPPPAASAGTSANAPLPEAATAPEPDVLLARAQHYLVGLLSHSLQMPPQRIDAQAPLEQYGIDSVLAVTLTQDLEQVFGPLSKTLFFEYQTIAALTRFFVSRHAQKLLSLLDGDVDGKAASSASSASSVSCAAAETVSASKAAAPPPAAPPSTGMPGRAPRAGRRRVAPPGMDTALAAPAPLAAAAQPLDIAIVGLSGRYPQADSVGEYWENLLAGRDCITEIPDDRWDWRRDFAPSKGQPGKTYSKWGGFLRDVDKFDPLFFNISPREAQLMDPQERLFLECAYGALEDAGYTRARLAETTGADGDGAGGDGAGVVGVFVGSMYQEYQLYGAQAQAREDGIALSGSAASIANRVSYFGNFHGPSLTLDTMCSSSLTAIHLACQSLRQGQCAVAIAGGVNVSVHPNKYLFLAQGQFASSDGRCTSFGEGGDGYVPGEGVGAVVLKPLAQAEADGDHIYGV
ncbi:SDR family NAD(P)-dependent oxidoreductase, partial [Burkholderia gladioli]|uniref:SDR family NAD(P)-dependent oxidoreductase n=1 Tax=Burkholderia gladioli TaxID=28095 RepID=UPI00163E5379